MKTERTALLSGDAPRYAFDSSISRKRKTRLRHFQICLCGVLIFFLILALIISSTLTFENSSDNSTNASIPTGILDDVTNRTNFENLNYLFFVNSSWDDVEELKEIEKKQPILDVNSASYRHQMSTSASNRSKELSWTGYAEQIATENYYKSHKRIPNFCETSQIGRLTCYKSKYRTYDGSCNNLKIPNSGVAFTPFRRVLPPRYSDGISSPRKGVNGSLPSPRTISNVVHRPYFRSDPKFTVMLAVFGQFLDHDITATAASRGANGAPISCCEKTENLHPECFPVYVDPEDGYYKNYNVSCMNFVRSAPAKTSCLGPREQINQVSSFVDASVVYGSSEEVALGLRTMEGGLMKVLLTEDNRSLLPVSRDLSDGCNREEMAKEGKYCFASGDSRANENVHLTTMHLIWTRHHNNLARTMHSVNPHWGDERVFQEIRRILIAQIQHIAYGEFLRIILGDGLLNKYELAPKEEGYFRGYDQSINAAISNNFAASSFRFGHSLIPTLVRLISNDTENVEYLKLHEILFDPFMLYKPGELDRIIKGLTSTRVQTNDPFFTPELKNHLFENANEESKSKVCGLDLVSLNIQRGRDHGLPPYVDFREVCGLSKPKTFDELKDIDEDTVNYIRSVYSRVEDVDLYTGSVSERPAGGGLLGPTLACLVADQFARLKRGDRHWYELEGAFTRAQLRSIRRSTLGGVLCANADAAPAARPRVLEAASAANADAPCAALPAVDLRLWAERRGRVRVPAAGVVGRKN